MVPRIALAVVASFVLASDVRAQAPDLPRTDWLGDPLPAGAVARLGTLRFKHLSTLLLAPQGLRGRLAPTSTLSQAVFSPDAKKIATLALPGPTMRLWDARTGSELHGPWNATRSVQALAFSADGKLLAATGIGLENQLGRVTRTILLWDVTQAKPLRSFPGSPEITQAMVFTADGKTLITAGAGIVRWWDVATGKEQRSWKPFPEEVQPIEGGTKTKYINTWTFSPGAKFLAVGVSWRYSFSAPKLFPGGILPDDSEAFGFDLDTCQPRWHSRGKVPYVRMQFAFSGDEKRIALSVEPNKLELRDAFTGKLIDIVPLETTLVGANSAVLARGVIPPPLLRVVRGLGEQAGQIAALALSSDGTKLAIGGHNSQILLWDPGARTKFRKTVARMTSMSTVSLRCLAFSPDDKTLAAGADSDLQVYDTATLKEVFPWEGHRAGVDYLAFSRDGKQLLSGSAMTNFLPNEVVTWDTATWKSQSVKSTRTPSWPNLGVPSPEYTVFTGKDGDDRLGIYDEASGKLLGRLTAGDKQNVNALSFFSPGGKFYLLAGRDDTGAQIIRLFAIPSCKLLCELPTPLLIGANDKGRSIAFSADGRLVAIIRKDQLIQVFETNTGKVRLRVGRLPQKNGIFQIRLVGGALADLAFSPDGNLLAAWTANDQIMRVWDLRTGKERLRLPYDGEQHQQMHVAWSPDGRTLAVADSKIQLWEAATGKLRTEFDGHQAPVLALAFSPDGRLLASGSADTTALVWRVWKH